MKKSKLLISIGSIAGVFAASMPLSTLSSCSCSCSKTTPSFEVSKDENIELVTCSNIEKGKDLSIVITLKEGYQIDTLVIKIGDKQLTAETDYTITDNIVTVKASAMTSVQVKVEVKSKLEEAPTVALKYDAMKELVSYTYEVIPINYPFTCNSIASFFGLEVTVGNLKVDNVTKTVPANLITWKLSSTGDIIVDFDITVLFTTFSITTDATVTFDLTFKNTLTGLDTSITGFKLNIKYATKPTEGGSIPWNDETWWDINVSEHVAPGNTIAWLSSLVFEYPKIVEYFGYDTVEVGDLDSTYENKPVLLNVAGYYRLSNYYLNIPQCVETLVINDTKASEIVLSAGCATDGEPQENTLGFKTIDLGKNLTSATTSTIYISGCSYWGGEDGNDGHWSYEEPSLLENTKLEKIIFSSKRQTVIQSKIYSGTVQTWEEYDASHTPFNGCKNLKAFDVTDFKTLSDVNKVNFIKGKTYKEEEEAEEIPIFNSDYDTHASTGSIIVPKGASQEIKDAWKTKFETAGLTIDGTNWKIEEAAE